MSFLCMTCEKYWSARAVGIPGHTCMAAISGTPCGSPIAGLAFPMYSGPITDFLRQCFVCGDSAHKGIRTIGSDKTFGLCLAHGPAWIQSLRPDRKDLPVSPMETRNGSTEWQRVPDPVVKASLGQLLVQAAVELEQDLPETPEE